MPYEVTKTVNGRAYRYRVERQRDPVSGKTKARWTYLGRAGGDQPRKRSRADATRDRLLDALEALVETKDWSEVTVDALARQAGVAHGTLYRHFEDRWDVLRAARLRWAAVHNRENPPFDGEIGTLAQERHRLRLWVSSKLALAFEHPGLVRAFAALSELNEVEAARRLERRNAGVRAMSEHIGRLAAAGLIAPPRDREQLSRALILSIEGVYREAAQSVSDSKGAVSDGVADLFDRAVFATL